MPPQPDSGSKAVVQRSAVVEQWSPGFAAVPCSGCGGLTKCDKQEEEKGRCQDRCNGINWTTVKRMVGRTDLGPPSLDAAGGRSGMGALSDVLASYAVRGSTISGGSLNPEDQAA